MFIAKVNQENSMTHLNNDNDLTPGYDHGIVPAEVAARKRREGQNFGHLPNEANQIEPASVHTSDGYTVDREGLLNNYAIEPEMYFNELGDLKQQTEAVVSERRHELEELRKDETGKLTTERDLRHKGPGLI
jgi:hypothetical protein